MTENRKRPLVSVIVTTYYRNNALRDALDSVINQSYEPIEILVVDGSGTRHAEEVITEYNEVKYIAQGDDKGAQAAREVGVRNASGDYINFLDDDDCLHKEKLNRQIEVIESNDEVGVVYCGKLVEDGYKMMPDPEVRGDVLDYALMFQMTPSSPSTMLIEFGVISEILPLKNRHGADDLGMKIELAQITKFDFVDEALVTIKNSEQSLGSSMENVQGRMKILEDYEYLYHRRPDHVRKKALSYTYILKGEILINQKVWSVEALYFILLSCIYFPGINPNFLGYFLESLFGRPGRDFGRRVYMKYMIGKENRGKIA